MTDITDYKYLITHLDLNDPSSIAWNWTTIPSFLLTPGADGYYNITYSYMKFLSDIKYFANDPNHPTATVYYNHFAAASTGLENTINSILQPTDAYAALYSTVSNIHFALPPPNGSPGMIFIGSADNLVGTPVNAITVIERSTTPNYVPNKEGNIFYSNDYQIGNFNPGAIGYLGVVHELGHALGLKHPNIDSPNDNPGAPISPKIDSEQYSIMSNNSAPGMANVHASGLQLFDIAAIQSIYGANYTTRAPSASSDGNTVYGMGHGFGATPSAEFIYTIWDGGGTNIIDASSYGGPAKINLNQGSFSSIGPADHGFAQNNVAIAFGTVIQNALGSQGATTFVGNLWSSVMAGTGGFNTFYTDQLLTDNGTAGIDWVGDAIAGKPSIKDPLKWANDPNYHAPPILKNDVLIGDGNGNTFFSGKGNNVIEGGYNLAEINSAANALVSGWGMPTAQNYWDSAHQFTADPNDPHGAAHNVSGTPLADVAPANALSNTADYIQGWPRKMRQSSRATPELT